MLQEAYNAEAVVQTTWSTAEHRENDPRRHWTFLQLAASACPTHGTNPAYVGSARRARRLVVAPYICCLPATHLLEGMPLDATKQGRARRLGHWYWYGRRVLFDLCLIDRDGVIGSRGLNL